MQVVVLGNHNSTTRPVAGLFLKGRGSGHVTIHRTKLGPSCRCNEATAKRNFRDLTIVRRPLHACDSAQHSTGHPHCQGPG